MANKKVRKPAKKGGPKRRVHRGTKRGAKRRVSRRQNRAKSWEANWTVIRPMLVVFLLSSFTFAGWQGYQWLMKPTTLPFRHVQVEGDITNLDQQLLQAKIKQQVSGGFFSQDIEKIMHELESIDWVYSVALRRMWPNRLVISVEEQQPIARWGKGKLLNRYGEIFSTGDEYFSDSLPLITGVEGRETDLILFFNQADKLLHPLELKMVALKEDPRGDQRLILEGGIELALGRKNRLQRLQRFASAYGKTLRPFMEKIEALDLRYANGFTVRWNRNPEQYASRKLNRI